MTRETGFYEAAASDNACLGINPRGARHFGAQLGATNKLVCGKVRFGS